MMTLSRLTVGFVTLAGLWACGSGDLVLPSETTVEIEVVGGDDQVGEPGSMLAAPLVVRVVDQEGEGIPGQAVVWTVSSGGGSTDVSTTTTNSEGLASVRWTLGPAAGGNTLDAAVAGVGVATFSATGSDTGPPSEGEVDRLVFLVQPRDVEENETFTVEVALVDAAGDVVPLSGIFIYVGLFPEGSEVPSNRYLKGERFENTENGIASFELAVTRKRQYRLQALTDDLPTLGPHGPEPYLFSQLFQVR